MKNIRSLKSIILSPYYLLLFLFAASPLLGNAQIHNTFTIEIGSTSVHSNRNWIEYTYTKSISSDGTMSKPSTITTNSFAFDGSYIYHDPQVNFEYRYVYHHTENGSSVYYMNGRNEHNSYTNKIDYSRALMVSADKKTINVICNANSSNRSYFVYKKGVDRSIGEMYE